MGRLIDKLDLRGPPDPVRWRYDPPPPKRDSGSVLPKIMLGIVIVLAPFYIMSAYQKDVRRNDLVAACEAKGFTHKDCRDHYERYKPLPDRQ